MSECAVNGALGPGLPQGRSSHGRGAGWAVGPRVHHAGWAGKTGMSHPPWHVPARLAEQCQRERWAFGRLLIGGRRQVTKQSDLCLLCSTHTPAKFTPDFTQRRQVTLFHSANPE